MRTQPLMLCITTAGFLVGDEYPCYSMYSVYKKLLDGDIEDDSVFPLIYELDEGDDWTDESVWLKCCPSLGQTVTENYMYEQVKAATNNPLLEVGVKTKNFNYFMQSSETWISIEDIKKITQKIELEDFKQDDVEYSIGAIDLSEVDDLTVYTILIKTNDKLYLKPYPFIPLRALKNSPNKELYQNWIDHGYMYLIDEEVIDLDVIEHKIWEINEIIPLACIAYDPWRCKQLALKFGKKGLPMRGCKQGIAAFTEPTKEFTRYVYQGKVVLDDSPVLRWCMQNARLKYDENGNCKPVKDNANAKIDIAITMIQAIKLYMELEGIIDESDLTATAL